MPRISEFATEDLPPQIADPTWEKVAAHCPEQLVHIDALMRSFTEHGTMPRRYIEIAIVTVSRLNECRHCVGRHSTHLYKTGLGHETTERILDPECPGVDIPTGWCATTRSRWASGPPRCAMPSSNNCARSSTNRRSSS